MRFLTILGATGSIGMATLDVVSEHSKDFRVIALTGHKNSHLLFQQCLLHTPKYGVVHTKKLAEDLQARLRTAGSKTEVLYGLEALCFVASLDRVDIVMSAIVGSAGLMPTLSAIRAKKHVLLANKESLVMAGPLLVVEAKKYQSRLLPIDSEHNAIFQCLSDSQHLTEAGNFLRSVTLTASGGALRDTPLEALYAATPEQACKHPVWKMGPKISVDSATLMNKSLEIIEASYLFGLSPEKIRVVLHPEGIVHSLIEYWDGSTLAQMAYPDMRIPIAYALTWPGPRLKRSMHPLDLVKVSQLNFQPINESRYPALALAYKALQEGGTATTVLNAANEVAVHAFLNRKIYFTDIVEINQRVLNTMSFRSAANLESIWEDDHLAREMAKKMVSQDYTRRIKQRAKANSALEKEPT